MSTLLDQLRTEFENLKARAANAEARATAAEEELKRYQRADVGERVREYAHDHEQDTRDIPRLGIGATAERMHRQRGELLDIARQQQAEIERLKERLRAYDEADTIPVLRSSDCLHCYREHETCPYHSKYADRITPRTDTKPQPKVEPELLGASESLPEDPKEEAYRPAGQVPLAFRVAHEVWEEDAAGDIVHVWSAPGWQTRMVRPRGATWSEVEQKAARLLGADDAKAGWDRMSLEWLWTALGAPDHDSKAAHDAYHAGYDGAIEYRAFPTPSQIAAANKQGLRWEAASTKCEPLASFSHDADGYLLAHQGDSPQRVTGVSARLWVNDQWRPVMPNRRPVPWSRVGG